jgi:polyadenylate-binding protein
MATIEQYSPDAQQQILGERIYHVVHKDHPQDAGKITGMLLEMDIPSLVHLVNRPDQLSIKTKEVVEYLNQQTD